MSSCGDSATCRHKKSNVTYIETSHTKTIHSIWVLKYDASIGRIQLNRIVFILLLTINTTYKSVDQKTTNNRVTLRPAHPNLSPNLCSCIAFNICHPTCRMLCVLHRHTNMPNTYPYSHTHAQGQTHTHTHTVYIHTNRAHFACQLKYFSENV